MAPRRSAAVATGPGYNPNARRIGDPNESFVGKFLREQILAPELLPGNVNILTGVVAFVAGIAAVRTWGELMVPL